MRKSQRPRVTPIPMVAGFFCAPIFAATPDGAELARAHAWAEAKFSAPGATDAAQRSATTQPSGLIIRLNYGAIQQNRRDGNQLKIGEKIFEHGIYCHANSRILVRLPAPARSLSAQIGIDTNGNWGGGTIVFQVERNGQALFKSPVCSRGEGPRPLTVELNDATEVTLIVNDAGDNINSDQADWAEAVFTLADGRSVRLGDLPVLANATEAISPAPPISFTIDGRRFHEDAQAWRVERSRRALDAQRTERVVTWIDPKTKLAARCVAVEYFDFPVVEWTVYLRNNGSVDSPLIENVKAIDTEFPGTAEGAPVLHSNRGDDCTPESYAPRTDALADGNEKKIANTGGRPTQNAFPYFNLAWPKRGIIAVLSWAGQWNVSLQNDAGDVGVRGGQELTHFKLHPGEEVRGPMVVLLFYEGDWLRGQNLWRAWMVAHNLPRPGGKLVAPMISVCNGNYYPGLMTNAKQEIAFLKAHVDHGIRFDNWWEDAGWYPCDGVTWPKTGTWEVDPVRFPSGLREVSDYVHAQGAKSIVWFEPERVHAGTWLTEHHPEWIHGGKNGGLLKLGNPACRAWLTDHIDRLLTEQKIDTYRQDFNIDPLPFWRAADSAERQGIAEIRHIEGYFAYWDELRRRHPDMLIDSCASGGRRNDLETLRRAVPLLRSDWYNAPDGQQCQTYGLSLWIPYQGTAGCLYGMMNSEYWMRSQMVAEFTIGPDSRGLDAADWPLLQRMISEWREVSDCLNGDFVPLTPYSPGSDCWMAWQYDDEAQGKGVVQAFRRGESIYEAARLPLRNLRPDIAYDITELPSAHRAASRTRVTGRELMSEGLRVSLTERPQATTFLYQRLP